MKVVGFKIALLYLVISTVVLPVCFLRLNMEEISGWLWFLGLFGFFLLIPFFHRIDCAVIKEA